MVETILKLPEILPFGGRITMSPWLLRQIEETGINIQLAYSPLSATPAPVPFLRGQYIDVDTDLPLNKVVVTFAE